MAVGGSTLRKNRLAAASGHLQLGLAMFGPFEIARRVITGEDAPNFRTMIIFSLLALTGNIATILVLEKAKNREAHFQASWILTADDIKVNGFVVVSAIIVALTGNATADLIAGAAIFLIVRNGARRILKLSRTWLPQR